MNEKQSYWQQAYRDASPPRVVLWTGRHRHLVRLIGFSMSAAVIVMLVLAVRDGTSVVSPILNLVLWGSQTFLWGFSFPMSADRWRARQTESEAQ